jgi:Phage integrase SAM-like domain
MATLKVKARSPFWYVQFKDPSGKWKTKATKYRRDNERHTKEARMRCKENTLEERLARKVTPDEKWENWIHQFFNLHCSKLTNTKESYEVSWTWLNSYFVDKGILTPSQVTYDVVIGFINWRIESCGVMKSTALKDRKVLRVLMQEAVRRGYAIKNPCLKMGISNDEVEPAPEFTPDQIKRIYAKMPGKEADWRHVAFRIGLETGSPWPLRPLTRR